MPQLRNMMCYFELVVGYGSSGCEPDDGAPVPNRSRHIYFGVSLNISEILRNTVFRGTAEKARCPWVTETALEYVQIPVTAVLADHRL